MLGAKQSFFTKSGHEFQHEIYTFRKLDFSVNVSSFFVELIQGPETYVLSPTRLPSGGTHLHFLYKENHFSLYSFLATFVVEEEAQAL